MPAIRQAAALRLVKASARTATRENRAGDREAHAGRVEVPAGSTPVRTQLASRLRALITEGVYRPGERMTERALCERLSVSRPSIREALRQLEAERLIDILPNRGPVVRTINVTEALELYEVRLALETLIARRFAMHGTAGQIGQVEDAIRQLQRALRSRSIAGIKVAKNAFFEAFAAGANNTVLSAYLRQVNVRLSVLWSSSLMVPGRPEESIDELVALASAIRNRNPDASQAAVVLHHENSKAVGLYGLRVIEDRQAATLRRSRSRKARP